MVKEAEGVVVGKQEKAGDRVGMSSGKGKNGPADESEERCSPDDEREIGCDKFEISGASDEGRCGIGDDSAIPSTVAGSSELGQVCFRYSSENSKGAPTAFLAASGICGVSLMADSYSGLSEGRGGTGIGCIEYRGSCAVTGPLDWGGLE